MLKNIFSFCFLFFMLWGRTEIMAQYEFRDTELLDIIHTIEKTSDYRFLYREAQVADISLTITATKATFIATLSNALAPHQVSLKADTLRKQIILYRQRKTSSRKVSITGQVVDAETGERLPYATLFWDQGNSMKGVAGNASGMFNISASISGNTFTLSSSYLGYRTNRIDLDLKKGTSLQDITLRLEPLAVKGHDIIVTGFNFPAKIGRAHV